MIEIDGNKYNLDHLVAIEERAVDDGGASEWSGSAAPKELVVSFCGGVQLRVSLSERERIERLLLGGRPKRS